MPCNKFSLAQTQQLLERCHTMELVLVRRMGISLNG